MSSPIAFFETQTQLTTWTDELEFLSYVLCELIDAKRLSEVRQECHQAADFPTLSAIIRLHIRKSSKRFAHIMNKAELNSFDDLLMKAKQIRNQLAHHAIPTMDELNRLKDIKQRLSTMLEFAIKKIASDHGIEQVSWSPCHHIYQTYKEDGRPSVVRVPLNEESLLSFRERTLRERSNWLSLPLNRHRKHKSTEISRKKQEDDYKVACLRKQQRIERNLAVQSNHLLMKLRRLEHNFEKNRELRFAQINKIKLRIRKEEEIFQYQRSNLLRNEVSHQGTSRESFIILALLAICSPLWIPFALMYNLYGRYPDHANNV